MVMSCLLILPQDAPALIGEMDSSGSLNAHALLHLTERVRARTVFQVPFPYPPLLLSHSMKEFYGNGLIVLAFLAVDPAVPVCNLAV